MVPDLNAACERMERLGVPFVKKPTDGKNCNLRYLITYLPIIFFFFYF